MITGDAFDEIKTNMLSLLADKLPADLTYHNAAHTADVLYMVESIAVQEGITGRQDQLLLKLAALFHDTGFLEGYSIHEERSCGIMKEWLAPTIGQGMLDDICGLIMATKIPQQPRTHLEQVICDADLDYLGRNDFEPVSNALKNEFFAYRIVGSNREWEEKQIAFFEQHHYFTQTSQNLRNKVKEQHFTQLKRMYGLQYGY